MLKIQCEELDFSALAEAFDGEYAADTDVSVEVVTVDCEEIRRLNRELRSVDSVTDVLSFPSLDNIRGKELKVAEYPADTDEEGNIFLGSIAICQQRAREQAEEFGHSYERELNYLIAHGIFHLLGYDHMTDSDKGEMREREERVMARMNLSREN